MAGRAYGYITNCTEARGSDIEDMVTIAKEIKYTPFISKVPEKYMKEFCFPSLHVKNDWHVKFYSSKFRNKKVYFMVHSCIEYVYGDKK